MRTTQAAYERLTHNGTCSTTPDDAEYYDIFDADPLPGWDGSPAPLIRRLHASDASAIEVHLLGLNDNDRHLRFFNCSTNAQIRAYVQAIDWSRSLLLGAIRAEVVERLCSEFVDNLGVTGNLVGSAPQILKFKNDFLPAQATSKVEYRANLASYPLTTKHDVSVPGSELLAAADFTSDPTVAGTLSPPGGPDPEEVPVVALYAERGVPGGQRAELRKVLVIAEHARLDGGAVRRRHVVAVAAVVLRPDLPVRVQDAACRRAYSRARRHGRWLMHVSALEFRGVADRGDGGVDQVADEDVALVVGGPEGTGKVGQAAESSTMRLLVLDG